MIGTILIAVFGYGAALWLALATVLYGIDFLKAPRGSARESEEGKGLVICFVGTLFLAALTRWLTGGAL